MKWIEKLGPGLSRPTLLKVRTHFYLIKFKPRGHSVSNKSLLYINQTTVHVREDELREYSIIEQKNSEIKKHDVEIVNENVKW